MQKLLMRKQELTDNIDNITGDIKVSRIEVSTFKKAITIQNKLDKGETTTDQERQVLKNVKEEYQNFFQEYDLTSMAGLHKAYHHFSDEKHDLKNQRTNLKNQLQEEKKPETIQEEEEEKEPEFLKKKINTEDIKKHTDTKDFKQDSSDITSAGEPMDFNDPDS